MAIKDKAFIKRLLFIVFLAPLIITGGIGLIIGLSQYIEADKASLMLLPTMAYMGMIFGALFAYPIMILFGVPLMLWVEYKKFDCDDARIFAPIYGFIVCWSSAYFIFKEPDLALPLGIVGIVGAWIVHAMFFFRRG